VARRTARQASAGYPRLIAEGARPLNSQNPARSSRGVRRELPQLDSMAHVTPSIRSRFVTTLLLLAALQGVALADNTSSVNLIANGSFDTPGRRRLRWPTGGRR